DIFSDVYVEILSQIGKPIDKPLVASVKLIPLDLNMSQVPSHVFNEIQALVNEELESIVKVTELVLNDKVSLY
ncbi:MAG: methionine adenosyltransferase, partial [Thermosphaera sp.]